MYRENEALNKYNFLSLKCPRCELEKELLHSRSGVHMIIRGDGTAEGKTFVMCC